MITSPYRPKRMTAPSVMLVTSAEAKSHCRLDDTDSSFDTLVDGLIAAASALLDGHTGLLGRCLVNQTWQVWFDYWGRCWRLPFPDVSAVTVTVTTEAGSTSTVAGTNYQILEDAIGAYLRFDDDYAQPSADLADAQAWEVQVTAGYGPAASDVPAPIRQAALRMIAHWYAVRESVNIGNIVSEVPMGAQMLLAPYRRIGV